MMNKDKIYQKMNELKVNAESFESVEISQDEKDRLFDSLKNQVETEKDTTPKVQPLLITFAVLFLLFIGSETQIGQRVQATASSIIENIQYSLNQALGNVDSDATETALSFNQTARIGDAEISIKEMIAFDHRIVFNVLLDLDGPAEEQYFGGISDFEIKVNGESLNMLGLTGMIELYDEEENIHSIIYSTELTQDISLEDNMTIEIILQDIHYYNPQNFTESQEPIPTIEGVAHFSVDTTIEELTEHTQIYEIDHFVSVGEYDYQIEALYVHPLINYIEIFSENWREEIVSENWGADMFQLIEIRGLDEQGRVVHFEESQSMSTHDYRRSSFTLNESESEISASELVDVEYLDLQFYSAGRPEGKWAEYVPYGESFIIEMK